MVPKSFPILGFYRLLGLPLVDKAESMPKLMESAHVVCLTLFIIFILGIEEAQVHGSPFAYLASISADGTPSAGTCE